MDLPVAAVTFHLVDQDWEMETIKVCSLIITETGKAASNYKKIIHDRIQNDSKVESDVLDFSWTLDNELIIVLGVEHYLTSEMQFAVFVILHCL